MLIKAEKLSKVYDGRTVLEDISFEIPQGSFVSLLGPSGSGKSTLLRLLSRLEAPSSGQLQVMARARERAFVFQDSALMPWMSARENVEFPFKLLHEQSDGVSEALEKVGLLGAQKLFPHQLSGGMKMRVSLARALVTKPKLLFMDEPFSALDETTRYELQENLYQLWLKEKMTVVFVTHSISEAVFLSENVFLLSPKGGHISYRETISLPQIRGEQIRTTYEFNSHVESLSHRLRSLRYV